MKYDGREFLTGNAMLRSPVYRRSFEDIYDQELVSRVVNELLGRLRGIVGLECSPYFYVDSGRMELLVVNSAPNRKSRQPAKVIANIPKAAVIRMARDILYRKRLCINMANSIESMMLRGKNEPGDDIGQVILRKADADG